MAARFLLSVIVVVACMPSLAGAQTVGSRTENLQATPTTEIGPSRGQCEGLAHEGRSASDSGHTQEAPQRTTVVIGGSTGLGISYLPLILMKEEKLLEKHAASRGLDVTMSWRPYPSAADMYDDLLSGKIGFASGGVTQLLTSWDRTRTSLEVKGVATLNEMPLDLVTSNPNVKTIADFGPKDRIAVPAVRTSIQAVLLSMAAEKAFGAGHADKLDPLTVALGHPEAMADLIERKSNVDAHISSPPFMYEELAKPWIHEVFDSYGVLGGPHTYNLVWATTKFHDANPKLVSAFMDALQDALAEIKADPATAAALWLKTENIKDLSLAQAEAIIRKPTIDWTMKPRKIMAFATFMSRTGLISARPNGLRDLFFDSVGILPGN